MNPVKSVITEVIHSILTYGSELADWRTQGGHTLQRVTASEPSRSRTEFFPRTFK